ncbi:death domain-containing protein 1 [Cololabis saira]|uniref:death domain-containing protein 1 n=1 Tax=Cololabis saira TaxID=129043 RepID=UPI002AD45F41|nr:death domain-containing protein 1 [Cololabis saira]
MDTYLHVTHRTNGANPSCSARGEDSLLITLTRPTEGVQSSGNHHEEPACGSREETKLCPVEDAKATERKRGSIDEEKEEKGCKQKVLEMLREVQVFHSDKLTVWRDTIKKCEFMLKKGLQRSDEQQHSASTDNTDGETWPCSSSLGYIFLAIGEDLENISDKVGKIRTKLEAAVLQLSADEAPALAAELQVSTDTAVHHEDVRNHQPEDQAVDGGNESVTAPPPNADETHDAGLSLSSCHKEEDMGEVLQVKPQVKELPENRLQRKTDLQEETEENGEKRNDKKEGEKKREWISVGLTGQLEDGHSAVPDQCFVRVPAGADKALRCEPADTLSCLIVTGSEELLSRVIHIKVQDGASFPFPATVSLPFHVQHRSSYRDLAVKVVNEERRVSYITPLTTEDSYRGHKGTFAEVKVYSLGLFAVVSCLKREYYTIPKRGLLLKLPMDPRICLNYLPGSFTAPVMAQTMIQPVDAVLLAAVKCSNDLYKLVLSASPLLYLTHPTSQPLRRPLTVTLPCPPNPGKRRETRRHKEQNHQHQSHGFSLLPSDRRRCVTCKCSKETSNESLAVLGSRDKQWSVLNEVTVRNQQNGLASFDLLEKFDSLLVVRLLSPLQPCHLISLARELEEAVCSHAVTIVLQRRQDDPHTALVAALPSRDLGWELSKLRARGLGGLVETSPEIRMCEGDQLLLRFSGNISSTAFEQNNINEVKHERLTFHSQRRTRLLLHLSEVDPFGNYSSPHYKGTVLFYKVSRGLLQWGRDQAVLQDTKLLGEPICKLSLTLPKKVRRIHRPVMARMKLCDETEFLSDDLLRWLSEELSQKETALLVSSLHLRRSAAQVVKLRAGDGPSAQTFHVLAMWRRALPAAQHQPKASQLAQCLAQSGRPDLAREVLLRQADLAEMRKLQK